MKSILRVYGYATVDEVGYAIAGQLRLKLPDQVSSSTLDVLARLAEPLHDAVMQGRMLLDDRPAGIARASVADVSSVDYLRTACIDLGWGSVPMPRGIDVTHLRFGLVDVYSDKLAPFIASMLRRWEDAGYFDQRWTNLV